MIIQCPECSKRYRVAEGLIAVGGRLVRCAACEYEWLARSEDDQSLLDTADAGEFEAADLQVDSCLEPVHIAPMHEDIRSMSPIEPQIGAMAELELRPQHQSQPKTNAFAGGLSEAMVDIPLVPAGQGGATCRIWLQLGTAMLSLLVSALIVLLTAVIIWPQEAIRYMPELELPLKTIGNIYNNEGVRIASVSLRSNYGERDLDMHVDVVIENTAAAERFVSKLRFVSYDAEMKKLGDIALDVSAMIPEHETKRVQGVLHRLPLSTRYISLDIGDGVSLALRDMGSLYRFTK